MNLPYKMPTFQKVSNPPFSSGCCPELDVLVELEGSNINYYQGLIGILRWIVALGQIDLLVPVLLLSRYMMSPREGHLQKCHHIFAYLKQFNCFNLICDDGEPTFEDSYFYVCYWMEYYPDVKEAIPWNMPEALGNGVFMTCFVDADHAGCKVMRRSQTGLVIYVNRALVVWCSKCQNTVESATFGSKFIARKMAIDHIDGLQYKLRTFGIPINGSTSIFCNNESVIINATHCESPLQ
jgi:hypothetical protein